MGDSPEALALPDHIDGAALTAFLGEHFGELRGRVRGIQFTPTTVVLTLLYRPNGGPARRGSFGEPLVEQVEIPIRWKADDE